MKRLPLPVKSSGSGSSSSTFSDARTLVPAAMSPTSGTWRAAALYSGARCGVVAHFERPWLGRVAAEVALPLEGVEMSLDCRGRGETDGKADLTHRWRVATLAYLGGNEIEYLSTFARQSVGHLGQPPFGSAADVMSGLALAGQLAGLCLTSVLIA